MIGKEAEAWRQLRVDRVAQAHALECCRAEGSDDDDDNDGISDEGDVDDDRDA